MASGIITIAGVWALQDIAVSTPDALKDPKNPFGTPISKPQDPAGSGAYIREAASKAKQAAH
ncbi:hypothetical protein I350_00696 [Cryptococcus amylolentus CBS 6273]|uniref:Uncharacterized protein n=1 Tax=Cryptococcus amylolentus CBS 6273 TaxID=1296118 RepID=A0A1E3KHW2_9TREE|nr:hypothetical protein I350_00696 [Cryptococcus amylolentus CBS 6273]